VRDRAAWLDQNVWICWLCGSLHGPEVSRCNGGLDGPAHTWNAQPSTAPESEEPWLEAVGNSAAVRVWFTKIDTTGGQEYDETEAKTRALEALNVSPAARDTFRHLLEETATNLQRLRELWEEHEQWVEAKRK
jgi:hypothetical protein